MKYPKNSIQYSNYFILTLAGVLTSAASLSAATPSVSYQVPESSLIVSVESVPVIVAPGFNSAATLVGYSDRTDRIQSASAVTDKWLAWTTLEPTLNTAKYIQFSIESAQEFSLEKLSFMPRNFHNNPGRIEIRFGTSLEDFDTDAVVIYTSNGRYSQASNNYNTTSGLGLPPLTVDLSGIASAQSLTEGYFRIYTYDVVNRQGQPQSAAWIGISDVNIYAQIPEAGTTVLMMAGCGMIAAFAYRSYMRRRQNA